VRGETPPCRQPGRDHDFDHAGADHATRRHDVALPHMQGSLSVAQDQIAWVPTSYIVTAAIMTPLTGWLTGLGAG
jgi:hypothetical protein